MISQNTKNTTTSKMVNIKTYFRKIVNLWFYSPITNWNLWAKIVSENRQAEIKHVCTQEQCVQRFQIFLNFSLILGKSSTFPGSNKSGGSSSLKAAAALNFQVLGPQCFRHHHLCRARCLQLLFSHRREPVQGPNFSFKISPKHLQKLRLLLNFRVLGPQHHFRHHHTHRARCLLRLYSQRREPWQGPHLLILKSPKHLQRLSPPLNFRVCLTLLYSPRATRNSIHTIL